MTEDIFDTEEEGLFARDDSGQLIRMVKAVAADFDKEVTIKIDGQSVTVKKAVPATDSQGNHLRDENSLAIPRATTIYDAARQLFVKKPGDKNPIPVLCHQEHVDPVAVCRICVVEIAKMKRGKVQRERKLLPACQHRVEDTMEVQTIESPDPEARGRVESAVKVLTEMLVSDHLQGRCPADVLVEQPFNELAALAQRLKIDQPRFPSRPAARGLDDSSSMIAVDHDACILCDRCSRGCTDVRNNFVIGHTRKGFGTRIAFDLDDPMGQSSCVSCGECMISCPTGALTLREAPAPKREAVADRRRRESVSVAELKNIPLFSNISYKFLQWNERSIERLRVKAGDTICTEGEAGSTAFVLLSGKYEVFLKAPLTHIDTGRGGLLRRFFGGITTGFAADATADNSREVRNGASVPIPLGKKIFMQPPRDLIFGEMTCLNQHPRSATVVAAEDGELLEIGRNVLYMMRRDPVARDLLWETYQGRALNSHLQGISLLKNLSPERRDACIKFLKARVELVQIDPGQVIFRQGDRADHFYMVRLGFVKVEQTNRGEKRVLDYLGPGSNFGEIGLISQLSEQIAARYPAGVATGVRTASCTALDDVELVRIRGEDFRELLAENPEVRDEIIEQAIRLLERDKANREAMGDKELEVFLENGLFNAQHLLVLDLESCTRCDECTRACADSHDGVTRLIREGLRFDRFLVASSCRSCLDPYCLVGCPVDAIHRKPREGGNPNSLEIVIEDWCIGCGQCAKNCPYGNINMHTAKVWETDPEHAGHKRAAVHTKATTCDLCRKVVKGDGDVSCVYACPHNAAFRMSGPELLKQVGKR